MERRPLGEITNYDQQCLICRLGDTDNLVKCTSAGLRKLITHAANNKDEDLLYRLVLTREFCYHCQCYRKYTRRDLTESNGDSKEEPQKKRQRSCPEILKVEKIASTDKMVRQCTFCHTNTWRKKLHLYKGTQSQLIHPNTETLITRSKAATEEDEVFYHSDCLTKSRRSKVQSPSFQQAVETSPILVKDESPLAQAAVIIRDELNALESNSKGCDIQITRDAAVKIVPHMLTTFLKVILGPGSESKVSSIGQDIVYASTSLRTPKHIALASTIRHWTGSKKIINLLNKLGHCVTYIDAIRIETAEANRILTAQMNEGVLIPENIERGVFVYGAMDNIDFQENTPDGKNTTHGTNMVLYQSMSSNHQLATSPPKSIPTPPKVLSLVRSSQKPVVFKSPQHSIVSPPSYRDQQPPVDTSLLEISKKFNNLWVEIRDQGINAGKPVPTWGAFNGRLLTTRPGITKLAYLPMVDSPATEDETVFKCLKIMNETFKGLCQKETVVFVDQAMYAKAKAILWTNPDVFNDTNVFMGGFHISMNYLAAVGKIFGTTGLSDLLEESGLFNKKVIDNIILGKPYTRALAAHMAVYEALASLRKDAYQSWCVNEGYESLKCYDVGLCLDALVSGGDLVHLFSALQKSRATDQFQKFISESTSKSIQFKYWNSYLNMIDLCLCQIAAERKGDFPLYIETLDAMCPVFFAADRHLYSRWLPVYVSDLRNLHTTSPYIYSEFMKGNFVVNRTGNKFSAVSPDMALEQSMNKDVKTDGGIIGFSSQANARERWCLTAHSRATMCSELRLMADDDKTTKPTLEGGHHSDNTYDRVKSIDWRQSVFKVASQESVNPFKPSHDTTVVNFVSGAVVPERDSKLIASSYEQGEIEYKAFVEQRLRNKSTNWKKGIQRLNIPHRPKAAKPEPKKAAQSSGAENIALYSRLLVVAKARSVDVKHVLAEEPCKFPPSLALPDGSLRKTDKSQLLHSLEKLVATSTIEQDKYEEETSAILIDAMAVIHRIDTAKMETFGDLAIGFLQRVLCYMRCNKSARADIAFDTYREKSIKSSERELRGKGLCMSKVVRILSSATKLPKKWADYLNVKENKTILIGFLKDQFKEEDSRQSLAKTEYIILSGDQTTLPLMCSRFGVTTLQELSNNHEEADTMMILHMKDAINKRFKCLYLQCDDTDIFVLALHFMNEWRLERGTHVWFMTGQKGKKRAIPLHSIAEKLDERCRSIIGLHAISGCDTVSSIYGASKSKFFKSSAEHHQALERLGNLNCVDAKSFHPLIFSIYGYADSAGTLNDLRYKLLAEKGRTGERLPPSDKDFEGHVLRANYQSMIWLQADVTIQQLPAATCNGWVLDDSGGLVPDLKSKSHGANVSHPVLMRCQCKGNCNTMRCCCKKNSLACTDACTCIGCANA